MKHILLSLIALTAIVFSSFAQQSSSFNFQGYAVNAEGQSITKGPIDIKVELKAPNDEQSYQEEHKNVSIDGYGVFNIQIGNGSNGTMVYSALDFATYDFDLKIQVSEASKADYSIIYFGKMYAVPYANSAKTANNAKTANYADNGVPVGTIISFAGPEANIPENYLPCKALALYQDQYPELFEAIGFSWGSLVVGTATLFRVPDLRGQFLRMVSMGNIYHDPDQATRTSLHGTGNTGNLVGSHQTSSNKIHNHSASSANGGKHSHILNVPKSLSNDLSGQGFPNKDAHSGVRTSDRGGSDGYGAGIIQENTDHSHTITVNTDGGSESRPINSYVYFIIKAK